MLKLYLFYPPFSPTGASLAEIHRGTRDDSQVHQYDSGVISYSSTLI